MMETAKVINTGVLRLSPFRAGMPLMVSGEANTGTTAMARALDAGGVPVTCDPGSEHMELGSLLAAWDTGKPDVIRRAHKELLPMHSAERWGVKVPSACVRAVWEVGQAALWPGDWIIMLRCPLALMHTTGPLPLCVSRYMSVVGAAQQLAQRGAGVVLVSYEKLTAAPERTLRTAELGRGFNYRKAAAEIMVGDPRYLVKPKELDTPDAHT